MTIEAVFFDLYGTLYILKDMQVELDEWITELHARLRRYGSIATKDDVLDYYEKRMWKEDLPMPNNGMSIFERRIQITCSDLGASMTRHGIEDTAVALISVLDKYAFIDPASIPILNSLSKRGKITALVSNYDHPQHVRELVQKYSLNNFFSAVIVSGDYGIKKPDPEIFRLALEKTGMKPGGTIYVGDSKEDVVGANQAGLTSVLIDRSGEEPDYGQRYTISDLQDLLRLTHNT